MTSDPSRVTTQKNEDLTMFSDFPIKILYTFSTLQCVLHVSHISCFMVSPATVDLKATDVYLGLFNLN